jgi:hypothetical protein
MAKQPGLALAGVPLVLGVAAALTLSLGSLEGSLRVLAPLSTFALPVLAMIAFWWEDWPGAHFRGASSLLVDAVVAVVAAVVLTMLGQAVVGHVALRGIFGTLPREYSATFPATMPLAACTFVTMLQLTLVTEGWPLRKLGRLSGGCAALAISLGVAVLAYELLISLHAPATSGLRSRNGSVTGPEFGAVLVSIGASQVVFFVALRGWPFSAIQSRAPRLIIANAVVLGGGLLSYVLATKAAALSVAEVPAVGGCVIVAGLVQGLLFDSWPTIHLGAVRGRIAVVAGCGVLAAAIYAALSAIASGVAWHAPASGAGWVAYATLNALGIGIILHVGIGRRWPLPAVAESAGAHAKHAEAAA